MRVWIRNSRLKVIIGLIGLALAGCAPDTPVRVPQVGLEIGPSNNPQDVVGLFQILLLLTILTLAPSILIMLTSFTRIVIVLAFVRNALGIPQMPPNQVVVGLALFLTFFVMAPVWARIDQEALQPYSAGQISQSLALERALNPVRTFMFKQTREKDIALFVELAKIERPRTPDDVPTYVLIPAFVISELKTAFQMGFVIFIPFLVIDMVVSSALMSMGMLMLPPAVVSLPFKLLLFVMVDGWHLIVRSLVLSFG